MRADPVRSRNAHPKTQTDGRNAQRAVRSHSHIGLSEPKRELLEEKQLSDLFRDMEKASRPEGYHYLSAFHLVALDVAALANPQCSDFGGFLDVESNSALNKLRELALQRSVQNRNGRNLNIYAVVDGQQRLTTLSMLAHMYATVLNTNVFPSLYVTLKDGTEIPRLIQHPSDDHKFLTRLLANLRTSQPLVNPQPAASQSQKRMLRNAELIKKWANHNPSALAFLWSDAFKTSVILLQPTYGLTSFMILNDRGKPLTVLEKFKSLLLECAFDTRPHDRARADALVRRLHSVFGKLYSALDACILRGLFSEGNNGDEQLMQLVSCYLRMDQDGKSLWQAGETAYAEYFRATLLETLKTSASDVCDLIDKWLGGIKELADQLPYLEQYLSGSPGGTPSIHFPKASFSLSDDYCATLISLGLQPHLLALLLKFRAKYHHDWHKQFPIEDNNTQLPQLVRQSIREFIADVR